MREVKEKQPDLYRKYKVTIGISKDEPERYVKEALGQILQYAGQEGISADRVQELLGYFSSPCTRTPVAGR